MKPSFSIDYSLLDGLESIVIRWHDPRLARVIYES